ncbi:hypothetical protein Tco_1257201, partial [Tanacetum coccineum]
VLAGDLALIVKVMVLVALPTPSSSFS